MINPYAAPTTLPGEKTDQKIEPVVTKKPGWILLLIAALMIFGPMKSIGSIMKEISSSERQYPQLLENIEWGNYKISLFISGLFFVGLSIFTGWKLLRVPLFSSVRLARKTIWIIGPLATLCNIIILPFLVFGQKVLDNNVLSEFFGAIFMSLIAATLWTMYLTKSKKVKQFYR